MFEPVVGHQTWLWFRGIIELIGVRRTIILFHNLTEWSKKAIKKVWPRFDMKISENFVQRQSSQSHFLRSVFIKTYIEWPISVVVARLNRVVLDQSFFELTVIKDKIRARGSPGLIEVLLDTFCVVSHEQKPLTFVVISIFIQWNGKVEYMVITGRRTAVTGVYPTSKGWHVAYEWVVQSQEGFNSTD